MSIRNEGPAGWAVHPGEILREEFLEPMGISAYRLAVELHASPPTVNDIVREKRGITPEMAARLAKYFGTTEQFWLNLQDAFAVYQVRRKYSKELKRSGHSPRRKRGRTAKGGGKKPHPSTSLRAGFLAEDARHGARIIKGRPFQ